MMKRIIKCLLLLAVIGTSLTNCTLWEESWMECYPPPEVIPEIDPRPWEPPMTDDDLIGK